MARKDDEDDHELATFTPILPATQSDIYLIHFGMGKSIQACRLKALVCDRNFFFCTNALPAE